MRNFIERPMRLLDKANEGGGTAGGAFPKPPPQQPPPADPPKTPPPGADDELDDLGYKKVPAEKAPGDQKQEGDKSKETPPAEPEKVENPATGYGDKEPEVDEKGDPSPPPPAPPAPTEIDKELEGLPEKAVAAAKALAEKMKLTAEQQKEWTAAVKQDFIERKKAADLQFAEERRQDQIRRQAWHKELKEDPAFGGDKFSANITRSEKILDEYGSELKKELTDAKQMLRPSVVRMLARIADKFSPDRKMVQGDPPSSERKDADKDKPIDNLAFYRGEV